MTIFDDSTTEFDDLLVEFDQEEDTDAGSMSWLSANASGTRWVHAGTGFGFGR